MESSSSSPFSKVKTQVLNDLDGATSHGSKLPPKRRTRFTYSSVPECPPGSDGSKLSNTSVNQSRSAEHIYLPSLSSLQRRRAFHNSMEDIHRNCREETNKPMEPSSNSLPLSPNDLDLSEDFEKKGNETPEESYHSLEDSISERDETESGDDAGDVLGCKNDLSPAVSTGHGPSGSAGKVTLVEENLVLKNGIEDERKGVLRRKVVCGLALEAMRRQKVNVLEMEVQLQKKREEVAARIILHHLLLNSWRLKSGELSCVMHENSQLHKTIDNLCLQLRVVRHLQSTEKEKSAARNKEFETSVVQLRDIRLENRTIRVELDKVAAERNGLASQVENLQTSHDEISTELRDLADKKNVMVRGSELNKIRAEKFQRENADLVTEVTELKGQVKSLTKQSSQWQEKARAYESECWELKLQIETRDRTLADVIKEKLGLVKDSEILALSKRKTDKLLKESKKELNESISEKDELEKQLQVYKVQLKEVGGQVGSLGVSLNRLKKENKDLRNNLYDYSLKNVRKRRAWGRALYFIFNPICLLRSFYFGDERQPPRANLGGNGGGDGGDGSANQFHLRIYTDDN